MVCHSMTVEWGEGLRLADRAVGSDVPEGYALGVMEMLAAPECISPGTGSAP